MGKSEARFVICNVCGQGYNQYPPDYKETCWNCNGAEPENLKTGITVSRHAPQTDSPTAIPEDNIKTYLHWRSLLTDIINTDYVEKDYDKPLQALKALQEDYSLDQEWLWTAYTPITRELNKRDNLRDPFREIRRLMIYGQVSKEVPYSDLYPNSGNVKGKFSLRDYRKKREGKGNATNWGFNVLVAAIVEDCHWYGKGKKFVEATNILCNLGVPEADYLVYNTLRKHYNGIDKQDLHLILKELCKACSEKGIPFIPEGVSIPEWPTDCLVNTANFTGYKKNPYCSNEKHMTEQMIAALPPHLQRLLNKRT